MKLRARLLDLLEHIGLGRKEAILYLAILEHPHATMKDLVTLTRLSKSTVYRAYEKLRALQLVSSSAENWRREIEALPLSALANTVGKRQRKLRKIELELKRLNTLFGMCTHTLEDPVEIITNEQQIKEKAFEILSRPWDRFQCYGSAERLPEVLGEKEEDNWVKERFRRGKATDVIITEVGKYAHEFLPRNDKELRKVHVDIDENNQDYCTYIYDDEVTIWHRDIELGNRAIVITDPVVVSMQKKMFNDLWKR